MNPWILLLLKKCRTPLSRFISALVWIHLWGLLNLQLLSKNAHIGTEEVQVSISILWDKLDISRIIYTTVSAKPLRCKNTGLGCLSRTLAENAASNIHTRISFRRSKAKSIHLISLLRNRQLVNLFKLITNSLLQIF